MEIAKNFKTNVIQLIDYLIETVGADSDLLAVSLAVKMINEKLAIENFIKHSDVHRAQIASRSEDYFLNDEGNLFAEFSEKKVSKFKKCWQGLSAQEKESVWKFFEYFLRLADRYRDITSR